MSKTSNEKAVIEEIYHSWLMARGHNPLDYALEIWAKGPDHSVTKAKNAGWATKVPFDEWSDHWETVGQHIIEEMEIWICNAKDLTKLRRPAARELLEYKALFEGGKLGAQGQTQGSKFGCDVNEVVFRS